MGFLTERESRRLIAVREQLSRGANPYSHFDQIRHKSNDVKHRVRKATLQKREQNWEDKTITNKRGRVIQRYMNPEATEYVMKCIICGLRIDYLSSIPGKKIHGMGIGTRPIVSPTGIVVEQEYKFPMLKTGRACVNCKDKLDVILCDTTEE